jgi:hypothetical protein
MQTTVVRPREPEAQRSFQLLRGVAAAVGLGGGGSLAAYALLGAHPLAVLPVAVGAVGAGLILAHRATLGDIEITAEEVRLIDLAGVSSVCRRADIARIVRRRVARAGQRPRDVVLVVGAKGRCLLRLRNAYDLGELGAQLRVAVEGDFARVVTPERLRQEFPGSLPWWPR